MTPELQERIAKAINKLHKQGVKANLIILGRSEEILLEGDNPDTIEYTACKYMIDDKAKSRCDIYGQFSTNFVKETTYKKNIPTDERKFREKANRTFEDEVEEEIRNQPLPPPQVYKQAILKCGFIDKSFKNRYKEFIECYHLQRPIGEPLIILEKQKNGTFKIFKGTDNEEVFEGIIGTSQELKEILRKVLSAIKY